MQKWMFGLGMQSLPRDCGERIKIPVNQADLCRMGIPARKVPRVLRELSRAVQADKRLNNRPVLLRMARQFAGMLL